MMKAVNAMMKAENVNAMMKAVNAIKALQTA